MGCLLFYPAIANYHHVTQKTQTRDKLKPFRIKT